MLRRRKSASHVHEDDTVQIADEHAWWAAREELDSNRIPTGRTKKKRVEEAPRHSTFEDHFRTESLFDRSGTHEVLDESDPYVVLGLLPSASWQEIRAAHRRLAKLNHPDRLVNAPAETRAAGDQRIRLLNVAYMELRRRKGP